MWAWIVALLERRRQHRNVKACLALVRESNVAVQRNLTLVDRLKEVDR